MADPRAPKIAAAITPPNAASGEGLPAASAGEWGGLIGRCSTALRSEAALNRGVLLLGLVCALLAMQHADHTTHGHVDANMDASHRLASHHGHRGHLHRQHKQLLDGGSAMREATAHVASAGISLSAGSAGVPVHTRKAAPEWHGNGGGGGGIGGGGAPAGTGSSGSGGSGGGGGGGGGADDPRMLVRTGSMQLHADRGQIQPLAAQVKRYTESLPGGYVESSQSTAGYPEAPLHLVPRRRHRRKEQKPPPRAPRMQGASVHMQLAVPAERFAESMAFLGGLVGASKEDLIAESESVADVTEQFVDTAARAASLEGTHRALLALMERGKDVAEVLNVQRELRVVHQALEAKKATLKSLRSRADFSRISLRLQQRPLPPQDNEDENEDEAEEEDGEAWGAVLARWRPRRTIKRALRVVERGVAKAGDAIIFVGVVAAPACAAGLVLVFIMRRLLRLGLKAECVLA